MIAIAEPNLTGREQEYVADAIASGWVSGGGPYVERFEEMVAKACGKRHCIATITGTAALHAAMRLLKFSGGIRVPAYTFAASLNVIRMIGGKAMPGDGDLNHDCGEIYQDDPFPLSIVDAAPAVGCISSDASIHTLSFNGNKTITTGQGGALLCDDSGLADALRRLIRQTQFDGEFNYRMPNLNAAMGCAQMERLDEFLDSKRAIWDWYKGAGIPLKEAGASRWMCLVNDDSRPTDEPPFEIKYLWGSPYYCLPCSTNLTREDQDRVIQCVS